MREPTFSTFVKRFPKNIQGRDFIVGDLHGCYQELMWLMKHVKFSKKVDRLFCVGDMVDRGPFSETCLRLCNRPWFHAVRGNHEQLMINDFYDTAEHKAEVRKQHGETHWERNGGSWGKNAILAPLVKIAEKLPAAIVVGDGADRFNIVHAEFLSTDAVLDNHFLDKEFKQIRYEQMLWGRTLYKFGNGHPFKGEGLSLTYCGHSIVSEVSGLKSHVFLDTGGFCAYPGYWEPNGAIGRISMIEHATKQTWEKTMLPREVVFNDRVE